LKCAGVEGRALDAGQGSAVFSVPRLGDVCGARELVDVEYHDHEGWMVSCGGFALSGCR